MTSEYTFYRAEGLSLSILESAEEARIEWDTTRAKLEQRFGSCAMFCRTDEASGRLKIDCFAFRKGDKTPEGWDINPGGDQPGSLSSGMPKPGSPDDFYLAGMAGLLDRAVKTMQIENGFGAGDMPRKSLPAGKYHGEFVRDNSLEVAGEKPVGRLRDRSTFCFGSNSAVTVGDPVEYLKLDGSWYLRVPNKPGTEEPQFVPPDAVRMDYDRMLALDKEEYELRYGRPRPPFRPPGTAIC